MKVGKDKKILEGILNHDSTIINDLYKNCLPKVEKMILHYGGDPALAKDIFQEAMIIIYRKVRKNDLVLNCKISTYIVAICKNLGIKILKEGKYFTQITDDQVDVVNEPDPPDEYDLKIRKIYERHFLRLSKDCQKIISMHLKGRKAEEIKRALKYKSVHHTMDRKYRCKSSLIKRIMNDPEFKELKNENQEESDPIYGGDDE